MPCTGLRDGREAGRARVRSSRPCSEPGRRPTPPASTSSRRASCARARSGRWRSGPASRPASPCSTCAAASPGRDGSSRGSSAAATSGSTPAQSAIDIARERAGGLPCRFEVAQVPPLAARHVRRRAPARDDARLSRQGDAGRGGRPRARRRRSVRLHAGGGPAADAESERARMPDADTVWLTPLDEMHTLLERAGLVVRWQEDCSRSHRADGGVAARRVRRRRDGHRCADRTPGAGRAAGRPPALESTGWRRGRVRKFALVAERPAG